MSSLPAGWYKDPADTTTQRYWDGEGWLGKAIPADAVPPDGPPPEEPPAAPASPQSGRSPVTGATGQPGQPVPPVWGPPPGNPPPPPGHPMPPGYPVPPGYPPPPGYPMPPYPQIRPHGFALAGLGQRLMARILDILAVLVLNVVVNGWFAYQLWQEMAPVIQTAMTDPFGRAFRRWARLGLWTPLWGCAGLGLLLQFIDSVSPLFDQRLHQALHDKTAQTVVVALPPNDRPTVDAGSGGAGDSPGGRR
jgi:hypothetical protein